MMGRWRLVVMCALGLWACGGPAPIQPCTGPSCACGPGATLCGDRCVALYNDPDHCGACDHECGGAACIDQRCEPETLAVVSNPPSEVALDGDDLVFVTSGEATSSGALYRLPKAGGTPRLVYRGLGAQPALAIADGAVLVADSGLPDECVVKAGAGAILTITDDKVAPVSLGRHCVHDLFPFDGGLTWFDTAPITPSDSDDPNAYIARLESGASPTAPPAVLYSDRSFNAGASVRSGSTVIWRQDADAAVQLLQMPLTGGPPQVVVSVPSVLPGSGDIGEYAADAEQLVYVRKSDAGEMVIARSLADGSETILGDAGPEPEQISFDASFVYLLADGDVWALDRTSLHRAQLTGDHITQRVVQDERYLYLLQSYHRGAPQTAVTRVRKPAAISEDLALGQGSGDFGGCVLPRMSCLDSQSQFGSCVDLTRDPDYCGDCMTSCSQTESCVSGACTCAAPSMVCGAACVDVASDAVNCGRCGHSCGGGACQGGDCTPMTIPEFAQSAVQDAVAVYYASGQVVKRLGKQSLDVTPLGALMYVRELTSDATRLYVIETAGTTGNTNPGAIHAFAKDGLSPARLLYADRPDPRQIATAGDHVLWVEDASDQADAPATLVYAAADGSAIRGSVRAVGLYPGAGDDDSMAVAVTGSVVFWALGNAAADRGAIARIDLSAPVPALTLLTTLDHTPEALAVVNDQLYVVTHGDDGVLLSLPVSGGAQALHATGLFEASTVVGDADGNVYWLDGDSHHAVVHQLAPGAATSRVIEHLDVDSPVTLLPDGDRFYTASPDSQAGISVLTR